MAQVKSSGVGSVAVVRAITGATDPEQAAVQLMQQLGD
jgi:thiamine monophosphate synthase